MKLKKVMAFALSFALAVGTFSPAFAATSNKAFPQSDDFTSRSVAPRVLLWGGPINLMPHWYTKAVEKASMNSAVVAYYKQWRDDFYKVYTQDASGKDIGVIEGHITGGTAENEGDWKNAKCVAASEHVGYGMIIFALMSGYDGDNGEAKAKFDSLVRLYLGLKRENNLMAWAVPEDVNLFKNALNEDKIATLPYSATDGDFDIAYALLLADKQWPNDATHGSTYKQLALNMIENGIAKDLIFPTTKRIALGDWHTFGITDGWADGTSKKDLLQFNEYVTRSSDFMLENLRAFAEASPANAPLFNSSIEECYKIFEAFNANHNKDANGVSTGLISDFIINDYTFKLKAGSTTKYIVTFGTTIQPAPEEVYQALDENFPVKAYSENSCRVPQRLALDYVLSAAPAAGATDSREKTIKQLNLISAFANGKIGGAWGPIWDKIKDGYYLDGTSMDWGTEHLGNSNGINALQFLSCFVSSSVVNNPISLGSGFGTISGMHAKASGVADPYFKDTLSMLNLLLISGNWWSPRDSANQNPPTPVFNEWTVGVQYTQGDMINYNNKIWQCKYTHRADSPTWFPGAPGIWFWEAVK